MDKREKKGRKERLDLATPRKVKESESHTVILDSARPHGLDPRQAPLSKGFSSQEYWSGLPCPPPGDLPDPGIEHCIAGRFFAA